MTAPGPVPRTAGDPPDPGASDGAGCPACPHPLHAHDVIGARFCRATTAKALNRGCACARS